ncbi:MAG: hypothetical protein IKT94_00150 [Rikenellaceae bacterium]|nr:hypothetical protein [Rikenellaceae bacterium]
MVNDSITQLLLNLLAQHRTVVMPGIGSLRFRRIAAKLDGTTLTQPRNIFRYSSREEGLSLLDELIAVAGCTREEGEEAYRRWLHRIKQGHQVVIEGVGRIESDFFKPSEELERLLNPVATAPIVLRRRRSLRGVWIGLAAVAVVGAAGAVWWYVQNRPTVAPEVVVQTVEEPTSEVVEEVVTEEVAEPAPVEEVATPEPTAIGQMTSGVSYVVVGVFSTEENARKYIEQMARRNPEIACRVYAFQGSKFMVSGFESTDGAEASAFIRDHRAALPDLWVYKRK